MRTAYRIDELLSKTSEAHAVPKRWGRVVPMVVRIIRLQARTESSHNPRKPHWGVPWAELLKSQLIRYQMLKGSKLMCNPNALKNQKPVSAEGCRNGTTARQYLSVAGRKSGYFRGSDREKSRQKVSELDNKVPSFCKLRLERKASATRAPQSHPP